MYYTYMYIRPCLAGQSRETTKNDNLKLYDDYYDCTLVYNKTFENSMFDVAVS